ncbi:MAG: TetR/AcrR family transcriptional regulator [Herpetosiphonaceae bacterium]|nr:TetR/AcrR family transcriptional regulator [Herpetosiphonaceae bacterium]
MKRPDTYHHGHLRQALLDAARSLIIDAGVEALTLREVARRAGVTTGAPYHHFADKAALVAALARQSLDELDHIAATALDGISDPHEQLRTLGVLYVLYAVDHPAEFRLMFRPDKGVPFDRPDPAAEPVFRILMRVVDACRAAAGISDAGRDAAAITAWSLVHGLAALLIDGPLTALAADRERLHVLVVDITNRLDVV